VESLLLKSYYVLFFIELKSRRVHLAGVTKNPDSAWVTQQARNMSGDLREVGFVRFLIHDRDAKFTGHSTPCSRPSGPRSSPPRSERPRRTLTPNAGWGRFDRSALTGPWSEDDDTSSGVVGDYTAHYKEHRQHRAVRLQAPSP